MNDRVIFGLRLARLIIETGREPRQEFGGDGPCVVNAAVEVGEVTAQTFVLLVRKSDGGVRFKHWAGEMEDPTVWAFKWPRSAHEKISAVAEIERIINA